jgi:glycosyltransferase involved in cell wall biosynthesis
MQTTASLTVVIPTLNEADNLRNLVDRIDIALDGANIGYDILIVDDHSTDDTLEVAKRLARHYPVKCMLKQGQRGKAQSLLQGFAQATAPIVVMIDADLQYPPEEIVPMYELMQKNDADIVVTRRDITNLQPIRKLSSSVFNVLFARLLFGINFDTQSGLKMFKKEILERFDLTPSPWSFDLEFLVRSLENNYRIMDHRFIFEERAAGATKVKLISTTFELAKAAIKLRWQSSPSKIRKGYRKNSRFIKQSMSVAVLALLLGASFSVASAPHNQADALSLVQTNASIKSEIDALKKQLHLSSTTAPAANNTTVTPVITTPTLPSVGSITSSLNPTSSSSGSTPTTATTSTTTSTSANSSAPSTKAPSVSSASTTVDTTTGSSTTNSATPIVKPTQSKVTATTSQSIYSTPSSFNRSTSGLLGTIWKIALATSAICFISVMILKGKRVIRRQDTVPA